MVKKESEERLLAGAGRLLCETAVDAYRSALSHERIAEITADSRATKVSADTAYRMWGKDRGSILLDAARHVSSADFSGSNRALSELLNQYAAGNEDAQGGSYEHQREFFEGLLALNLELQFSSIGFPTGWALQGAALSSSPLWEGPRPTEDLAALGRSILAARGEFYEEITQNRADLLRRVMAAFARRPRYGYTVEKIVKLMHALNDGLILRAFIDPVLNDPGIGENKRRRLRSEFAGEAAAALFELAWAYTQEGSLVDPRHPGDDDAQATRMFDQLVEAAIKLYDEGLATVEPSGAAERAGLPNEAVILMFHDAGDLVDSVLRRLVAAAGMAFENTTHPLEMIESGLLNLNRAAIDHPTAVAAAALLQPTHPADSVAVLEEMVDSIAAALGSSDRVRRADPAGTAKTLVNLASRPDCWGDVKTMLRLLGAELAAG